MLASDEGFEDEAPRRIEGARHGDLPIRGERERHVVGDLLGHLGIPSWARLGRGRCAAKIRLEVVEQLARALLALDRQVRTVEERVLFGEDEMRSRA